MLRPAWDEGLSSCDLGTKTGHCTSIGRRWRRTTGLARPPSPASLRVCPAPPHLTVFPKVRRRGRSRGRGRIGPAYGRRRGRPGPASRCSQPGPHAGCSPVGAGCPHSTTCPFHTPSHQTLNRQRAGWGATCPPAPPGARGLPHGSRACPAVPRLQCPLYRDDPHPELPVSGNPPNNPRGRNPRPRGIWGAPLCRGGTPARVSPRRARYRPPHVPGRDGLPSSGLTFPLGRKLSLPGGLATPVLSCGRETLGSGQRARPHHAGCAPASPRVSGLALLWTTLTCDLTSSHRTRAA